MLLIIVTIGFRQQAGSQLHLYNSFCMKRKASCFKTRQKASRTQKAEPAQLCGVSSDPELHYAVSFVSLEWVLLVPKRAFLPLHTHCSRPVWQSRWELQGRTLGKKDLTTSGSNLVERSWMALTTMQIDDRRKITPKMTQALKEKEHGELC